TTTIEKEPEIAVETGVSKKNLDLVREGMLRVGTVGFCRNAFKNLPVKAAAKTGTSEIVKVINGVKHEGNNGFLISYAPFENPEIAIAVVVETADKGSLTAVVAADIYQYYFSSKTVDSAQGYNQLLS
ncbi:MAG: penicillin-binding transpeptidase domain-containing protein, partial [Oscillospiraceae bacterium]